MNLNDILIDPRQSVSVVAGSSITAGDLVTMTEDGTAVAASAALGVPYENNSTAGASVLNALTSVEGNSNYGLQVLAMRNVCALGSGNVAMIYTGNGTTASTGINLRIKTPLGANVIARTTLTSNAIGSCRCVKISSTQFVVAWVTTGDVLKFMVINNDGTTSVAETTVATLSNNGGAYWNIDALASGNFVFAYAKVTSTDFNFAIYNAGGALQGTETTIESAATPQNIAVLGCSNGDFFVSYRRTAATASYKAARYTSAGVAVGSLESFGTGAQTLNNGDFSRGVVELSNGSVAFAIPGTGDNYPDIKIYSDTHTLVATLDLGTSFGVTGEIPSLVQFDGGFAVIARWSTSSKIRTYSNTGSGLLAEKSFGAAGVGNDSSASSSGITAFAIGNVGYVVLRVGYDSGTPTYDVRLMCLDAKGVLVGSEVVLKASGTEAD